MGGKKKKNLAARLARMSDEERSRYLQRKQEQEDETRKRKEQLICTFMKIKIKKEQAFARLNLAKINQYWQKILRANKCREMKENVGHMREYIERVLAYKNRAIDYLLEELELAEEQYSYNFSAHTIHINRLIDSNREYMNKLRNQYNDDLQEIMEIVIKEEEKIKKNAQISHEYLKTIIHTQEIEAKIKLKKIKDYYIDELNELRISFRDKLKILRKNREHVSGAIWKEIAVIVRNYTTRNDSRRLHLAELRKIDTMSAEEIYKNQERITSLEKQKVSLKDTLNDLIQKNQQEIELMKNELKEKHLGFLKKKQQLKKNIEIDEKKIKNLTFKAEQSIVFLENLQIKGNQIIILTKTCRKLQLPKEILLNFLPKIPNEKDEENSKDSTKEESNLKSENCFNSLLKLELFWERYNTVEINKNELEEERKVLRNENKQLKEMIKAIFESSPNSFKTLANTKTPSRSSSKSAPLLHRLIC